MVQARKGCREEKKKREKGREESKKHGNTPPIPPQIKVAEHKNHTRKSDSPAAYFYCLFSYPWPRLGLLVAEECGDPAPAELAAAPAALERADHHC